MNTRPLVQVHCRPVSWATTDGYGSGEKRWRQRAGRQLDSFALAVVGHVGRRDAADSFGEGGRACVRALFSDQRGDRGRWRRVQLTGRGEGSGGSRWLAASWTGGRSRDKTVITVQRTNRQRAEAQTCNAFEAFCTSLGWPRIRGSGASLLREMRRRPGPVRLAV